jgi:uncharacterized phiE125 gp8 family phage protein
VVSVNRIQEPTADAFYMQDLKDHLRLSVITPADENNLQAYLDAATDFIEGVCGCSIMLQKWQLNLSCFPYGNDQREESYLKKILLPRGPLLQIDSVKYNDANGVQKIWTGYQVDKNSKPPAIYPAYGSYYPGTRDQPNDVEIIYTTGMGVTIQSGPQYIDAPEKVRTGIKQALKFLTGHFYLNREPVPVDVVPARIPFTLETLLWSEKIYRFDWEAYYSYSHW